MTQDSKPQKSSRWLKIALAASLCVNLLVLGAIGGAMLKGGPDERKRAGIGKDPVRGIFHALPRETRKKLRAEMRGMEPVQPQDRKAWAEAFAEAMRAEEVDQAELRALFGKRSEVMEELAKRGHETLIAELSAMTLEERTELAEKFENRWHHQKWRKK